MSYKLERVYVSLPRQAADALVRGAHKYSVPTLAATLVCRHFGIEWDPRPNGRRMWKRSEEDRERVREANRRSHKDYVKLADLPPEERADHEERKQRQRRERHAVNSDEVWNLTVDDVHYCHISHPKEWDSLPPEVRGRLLRNLYTRRRQKRVRDRIRAANEELKSKRSSVILDDGVRNHREVGSMADCSCTECVYFGDDWCNRYRIATKFDFLCDAFRNMLDG